MARPLRINFEGAWYHVMNRGINRNNIFFNDKQRHAFLRFLNEATKIYGIEIHAYCLMNNHYHIIIHTPRGNISQAMKYLNSRYAQFVNLSMKRDGPLFKGRFKAIIISADDYLLTLSRYIHLNPLEAKLVNDIQLYTWSSLPIYLGKRKPPDWLFTQEIINRFGKNNFKDEYKKFVISEKDEKLQNKFDVNTSRPALGSESFLNMIDNYVKTHSLSAEIVGKKRILIPPKIDEIVNFVANYFKIKSESLYHRSNAIKNPARKIVIYICRELGGYSLREIADTMGKISYKGIANTISRIKSDKILLKLAHEIMDKIRKNAKTLEETQT